MAEDYDVKFTVNSDGSVDMVCKQGSTWTLALSMSNSEEAPIDLTGWHFRGQVRRTPTSETVLASFSFEETDLLNGQVTAIMSAADSAALPAKDLMTDNLFYYDMERYQGDPEVVRKDLPRGRIFMIPEVTR